ncbi:choice-of-anchor A family protein [Sphingomonas sp. PL-96]|uniref:choice-of-anchor A family protein n=1 Tax=Sphingomonas sp. PL-96 TaxID=2887201 RepID=UPI001E607EDD|nr:choice-of-anchor A family protein [Sphingomonas sp. PL-96]MCC2976467.1 choice-of-anchor A family protein [Sphingomonas sp. PL-96]
MKKPLLASAVSALVLALPAMASPVVGVDALKEWNLIVLGDLTSSSEVEGRTFVGGNLDGNSSNYQIKTPPASSYDTPGLTVVGDVLGGAKNLNNASGAVVGGNVTSGFNLNGAAQTVQVGGTIANTNVNQNTVNAGLASTPGFTEALQQQKSLLSSGMTDLSQGMTKLASNSTVTVSGNRATFNATPDASGVAVFNLTSEDLNRIGEIQFNLNGADTAIVNVSGTNIVLNDNFLGGTQGLGEHVIWNFADATSLSLSTAWGGSVLAPGAAATTGNYIQGSAVFGSLVQNGEFHLGTYTGGYTPSTPTDPSGPKPVPEPGTWALMLAGLGLVALLLRRRRGVAA